MDDIEENPQWREQRDARRKLRLEAQEDAAACMARRDSAAHFACWHYAVGGLLVSHDRFALLS